ncbi:MAG: nucleoside triphosphate pyrophosphohydrolase [Pseudomonadota bacterium]|nr:nucleoside triphosphate pyrophosphohydrolase [Pseudomonadota bacterium]
MAQRQLSPPFDFDDLLEIMQRLRTPETGCSWDLEQSFETIAPYTIEEAYEVGDAIARGDMKDLADELGDLLLQVVFHAQIAKDEGHFSISDVTQAISEKMIRRHPHVFGSDLQRSAEEQTTAWEEIKAAERATKTEQDDSALAGVAAALPALMRSEKLQKRAARTGFDWTDPKDIFSKLEEEMGEVREAIDEADTDHIEEEVGDLLFVAVNLARRLNVDPEVALRKANSKFERRFRAMEKIAPNGVSGFSDLDLDAQEALWIAVKRKEKETAASDK